MSTTRETLRHLNVRMKQELEAKEAQPAKPLLTQFKERLYRTFDDMARDIGGDLWDASAEDGTGMGQQVGLAAYRASQNANHTAPMRFLHKKAHYLQSPSHIQQLMQFNEDKVRGEDTARVFAKAFGDGNIFDSATGSSEWREQRTDFQNHLFTERALVDLTAPMQRIVTEYLDSITEAKGEIPDVEDFTARFTMDMIGKTQLGFRVFPADVQKALSPIISEAIAKIANPKNSIEAILPERLVSGVRAAASIVSGTKAKSLDEIMAPGRKMLMDVIRLNEENILTTDNWLTSVSIKKAWCRKKVEAEGLELAAKKAFAAKTGRTEWPSAEIQAYWLNLTAKKLWPNDAAKKKWFYDTIGSKSFSARFNEISEKEWPVALKSKSREVMDILYSPAVLNDVSLFLVVGHETSAKFFQYTLQLLADRKHASVVQKMREEAVRYMAENKKTPEELTKKDLENLVYSQAVLLEGLRLFPPVPVIKAQAGGDVTLADIPECKTTADYQRAMQQPRDKSKDRHIRKGEYVFISPYQLHRDKAVYGPDAEVFSPERFINSDGLLKKPNPNAWTPFGFGRRMCVGQQFAKQEVLLGLLRAVLKFDLVIDDPLCYQVDQVFSLRPRHPVSARATEVRAEVRGGMRMGAR